MRLCGICTNPLIEVKGEEYLINGYHFNCLKKDIQENGLKIQSPKESFNSIMREMSNHFTKEECIFLQKRYNIPFPDKDEGEKLIEWL
jgi:hypothetical protein